MDKAKIEEILPCPFCGGEAKVVGGPEDWSPTFNDPDSGGDPISVICKNCECGLHFFDDYGKAIAAWNRRSYLEQGQELEKRQRDWECFKDSIATLIDCEPHDIQDMDYILTSVAHMQDEERNYSGIADELAECEAQLEQARADNAAMVEALKWVRNFMCGEADKWLQGSATRHCAEQIKITTNQALVSNPGADLLEELEQLRKTKKSMVELINQLIKDGGQYKRALELACEDLTPKDCVCCPIRLTTCQELYCTQPLMEYFLAQAKAGGTNA